MHHDAIFTFGVRLYRTRRQTSRVFTVVTGQRIERPLFMRINFFIQRVDIAPETFRFQLVEALTGHCAATAADTFIAVN
jgi:hypothetical protein